MDRILVIKSHVKSLTAIRNGVAYRTMRFNATHRVMQTPQPHDTSFAGSRCDVFVRPSALQSPIQLIVQRIQSTKSELDSPTQNLDDKTDQSTATSPLMISEMDDKLAASPTAKVLESSSNTNQSNEPSSSSSSSVSAIPLVYESPLGNVISKLRTVSLSTAIIGMTGVPCMIALKGGVIPDTGILAAALLFVSGSIGSTAAIHFVFSPYVYKIEQIPIRVCSTPPSTSVDVDDTSSNVKNTITIENETVTTKASYKDTLLKAWTRTLFLRHDSVVFDPTIDVQPYKGLRPMCNFIAKGRPLYVHSEYVYDSKLRFAMDLDKSFTKLEPKANPDDDLF